MTYNYVFRQVKGVVTRFDELIQQIKTDQIQRQQYKIDESLSIDVFNSSIEGEGHSSSVLNGQFIHSQLLIDWLIRMNHRRTEEKN